ncbi:MAG: hypothetical protein K1X64_04715 [Myxococcaceae bacterium]|nr:hypothetical protein [Myxococcaceae bacterium]
MKQVVPALLISMVAAAEPQFGIASKYVRDQGLDQDPSVIFSERFEAGTTNDVRQRWGFGRLPNVTFSSDVPTASAGTRSMRAAGDNDLFTQFAPAGKPGYNRVYVRWYTKLDSATCDSIHHWPWLGGYDPPQSSPWPRAGEDPAIEDRNGLNTAGRFSTGFEAYRRPEWEPGWFWDWYTYWPEMRAHDDGRWWGNGFTTTGWHLPSTQKWNNFDRWYSTEIMVKLNDFVDGHGVENGEQAVWLDGELISSVGSEPSTQLRGNWELASFIQRRDGGVLPGIRWRTTRPDLMINYFWLEHYVNTDTGQDCVGWYDDVVIATEYIGPMVELKIFPDAGTTPDAGAASQKPKENSAPVNLGCGCSQGSAGYAALSMLTAWFHRRFRQVFRW